MTEEQRNIQNEAEHVQQQIFPSKQYKPAIGYGGQFAVLIGLTGTFLFIGSLLTIIVTCSVFHLNLLSPNIRAEISAVLLRPENALFAQLLNTGFSFVSFFIPTIIVAAIANRKNPFAYIQFNTKISINQAAIIIVLIIFGMMLSGLLGELTEKIPLPATLLKKAKELEDNYNDALSGMIALKTVKDYLIALVVIALAPAIFEETFFRGGFQKILTGWTKNIWFSIIFTSLFFSAVHFSYFGFLSRFALGMLLGFVFYYSGNIWLNILLHFLNNGIAVTQLYFLVRSGKSIDKAMKEDVFQFNNNLYVLLGFTIAVIAIIVIVFKWFKTESKKINPDTAQVIPSISNNPFEE